MSGWWSRRLEVWSALSRSEHCMDLPTDSFADLLIGTTYWYLLCHWRSIYVLFSVNFQQLTKFHERWNMMKSVLFVQFCCFVTFISEANRFDINLILHIWLSSVLRMRRLWTKKMARLFCRVTGLFIRRKWALPSCRCCRVDERFVCFVCCGE